jgi:hypothetical protein
MKNTQIIKLILTKLRRPLHVSYISKYLTKLPLNETMVLINEMVEEGLIEESKYGKGYFVNIMK